MKSWNKLIHNIYSMTYSQIQCFFFLNFKVINLKCEDKINVMNRS